jgi:hypothetical protein
MAILQLHTVCIRLHQAAFPPKPLLFIRFDTRPKHKYFTESSFMDGAYLCGGRLVVQNPELFQSPTSRTFKADKLKGVTFFHPKLHHENIFGGASIAGTMKDVNCISPFPFVS